MLIFLQPIQATGMESWSPVGGDCSPSGRGRGHAAHRPWRWIALALAAVGNILLAPGRDTRVRVKDDPRSKR